MSLSIDRELQSLQNNMLKLVYSGQARTADVSPTILEILKRSNSLTSRYTKINVVKLLQDNSRLDLNDLVVGLGILEKYGKNLLKDDKPVQWKVVRLSNTIFHSKVDIIEGSRDILQLLGYTTEVRDGYSFPPHISVPDVNNVTMVTADIILLKFELMLILNGAHPKPQDINSYRQPYRRMSSTKPATPSLRSTGGSLPPTPSMLADLCVGCGQKQAEVFCSTCNNKQCNQCDTIWHKYPSRVHHQRKSLFPETSPRKPTFTPNDPLTQPHHPTDIRLHQSATVVKAAPTSQPHQGNSNEVVDDSWESRINRIVLEVLSIPAEEDRRKRISDFFRDLDAQIREYKDGAHRLSSSSSISKHLLESAGKLEQRKSEILSVFGWRENTFDPAPQTPPTDENLPRIESPPSSNSDFPSETPHFFSNSTTDMTSSPHSGLFNDIKGPPQESFLPDSFGECLALATTPTPQIGGYSHFIPTHNPIGLNTEELLQPRNTKRNMSSLEETSFANNSATIPISPQNPPPIPHEPLFTPVTIEAFQFTPSQPPSIPNQSQEPLDTALIFTPTNPPSIHPTQPYPEDTTSITPPPPNWEFPNEPQFECLISNVDIIMPSMTLQELELQTKKEEMRFNCSLMVGHLREGEREGFSPKQVEIALKWCGKQDDEDRRMTPLVWLRQNWEKKVQSLLAQNSIFSRQEITEALQDCGFDDIKLMEKLKLIKRAKIEEMRVGDSYSDTDIEQFLLEAQGDKSKAICAMQRNMLRPFLHRLEGNHQRPSMKSFIEITTESRAKNAFAAYFNCDNDVILGMMFHILHHKGADGNDFLSECSMADVMEAALSYPADVSEAIDFLRNECKICFKMFPKSKIECMSTCTDIGCKYCRSCLHQYLRHKINDTPRHVRDIVCPVCLQPDMEADEEMTTNYLNHLDALVRRGLDHETHQLFQKKLRDQALMKMPNFRWCSHCDNGFLYEQPDVLKMICSSCRKATCYSCKKPWEDQHEGISCHEFLQWKAMNDPDFQAAGLAAHLQEHGIDCPNCKFRYALAKGGCMHFKCSTCSFEFCSGCKASFKQGRNCAVLTTCHNKGLHAHHPRDCLFYLRDFEVGRLQTILEEAHVGFDTESTTSNNTCQVMELRETVDGLVDACCEGEVHDNNADLCELHYKEYLVNLINSHQLDPVSVFTAEELKVCLQREEHPIPVPDDEDYHEELLHLVRAFPLIHQMQR